MLRLGRREADGDASVRLHRPLCGVRQRQQPALEVQAGGDD
jgi:hypothetical protein